MKYEWEDESTWLVQAPEASGAEWAVVVTGWGSDEVDCDGTVAWMLSCNLKNSAVLHQALCSGEAENIGYYGEGKERGGQ